MRRMAEYLVLLTALLLVQTATASEASDVGPRRALPDRTWTFIDRTLGFSVALPRQFELTGDEPGLLYFQSREMPGLIAVRPVSNAGLADLQQLMRGGLSTASVLLKTAGSPLTLDVGNGQGMTMAAEGYYRRQPVKGYLAGVLGPEGRGYLVFVGAGTGKWPILEPRALSILDSFSVIPPEPGHEHERWQYRLSGKRLVFIAGYGRPFEGAAIAADITLCPVGSFHAKKGAGTYDHDPLWGSYYTWSGTQKAGSWQTGQQGVPYLRIDFRRGGYRMAPLEYADGFVFMDGRPYDIMPATDCR